MRPELNLHIDPEEFLNFYWLKEELLYFCKTNGLPKSGSKDQLTGRIYTFIKTGEVTKATVKKPSFAQVSNTQITLSSKIPVGYKNDENHRAFFKGQIGDYFKFNVSFMNWMKENSGKTYAEAIEKWKEIYQEKKQGKRSEISSQFQYNQYTRDFFEANPNAKRDDAIKCWKYKNHSPGTTGTKRVIWLF